MLHDAVMRGSLHTLPWPGFRPDGGLLLPLPTAVFSKGLPPALRWSGPTLRRKHEFHATLLNRACGSAARQALGDEGVRRFFQAQDWTLHRTGDARLLHKPGKPPAHTLVEMVELRALATFRGDLANATGQALPPVPPHVTLYTAGKHEGIGLPDQATLERLQSARLRLPGIGNRPAPPLTETLEAAYRATEYRVAEAPSLVIRIGQHAPACDALLDRHHVTRALLLSACNPYSEPGEAVGNELRHAMLIAHLHETGLDSVPAEGRDPSGQWPPEVSLLVLGTSTEQEDALLRDYEQHAVVLLQRGRVAELLWHPGPRDSRQTHARSAAPTHSG